MPNIKIFITNIRGKMFEPLVAEDIELKMERKGMPETLTFTVIKDTVLGQNGGIVEGNVVQMQVDDKDFFVGRIFAKSRDKNQHIKVTAYSQLRYLKNKYTMQYTDMTATSVIENILAMYDLKKGKLADTKYKIPYKLEDNVTMFDVIQNALDDTFMNGEALLLPNGGKVRPIYVLFDYCGKVMLEPLDFEGEKDSNGNVVVPPLQLSYGLDQDTAENYSYVSSIDEDTYNSVVLIKDNKTRTDDTSGDYGDYVGTAGEVRANSTEGITWFRNSGRVSTSGAKECTMYGLADVAQFFKNLTGNRLCVTSITDSSIHAPGTYSHGNGYKADVSGYGLEQAGIRHKFCKYCRDRGIIPLDEYEHPSENSSGGHVDLAFQGYNGHAQNEEKNHVGEIKETENDVSREKYAIQDNENIGKWGRLEYFSKESESTTDLKLKAKILLANHNRETRHLSVSNALGDTLVRAGCTIIVNLALGDIVIQDRMLVEKVTHKFADGSHFMDMTLIGGSRYFFS